MTNICDFCLNRDFDCPDVHGRACPYYCPDEDRINEMIKILKWTMGIPDKNEHSKENNNENN